MREFSGSKRLGPAAALTVAVSILAGGCKPYIPVPLTSEAVDRALIVPSDDALHIRAAALHHPLLPPIELNLADGLSPDEAAVLAVLINPALRAERARLGVAAAQLIAARILPNPSITVSLDQPFAGSTEGTVTGWGLGLDYDLSALITRNADIDSARAEQASVALDVAWAEWQAAGDARLHAIRLMWLVRIYDVAAAAEAQARQLVEAVRSALQQRMITQVELDAAEAEWQRFRITALEARAAIDTERLALLRSLGLPTASEVHIQPLDLSPPPPSSPQVIAQTLDQHRLDLLALRRGYESQEAKVRGAILSQFPKISVGVAAARDTSNVISIGPSVTLDLPLFDRAQGKIAIEEATRQQLFDEYTARVFEALSEVARLRSEMDAVAQKIDTTDAYVTRLEALQKTYADAVRRGDADVLNLHQVQNTLADTRLEALRLRQEQAELIVGLEIAQGQMFTASPATTSP